MKRQRGAILAVAILTLFIVMTISLAVASITLHNLRLTRRIQQSAIAFNLAESGAERAVRWIKDQGTAIYNISSTDPFGGTVTTTGGTYQVTVAAFTEDANAALKRYRVTAVGVSGDVTERVEIVVRQQSFGLYAYFTDKEVSSISNGAIWFAATDRIRGPAHSNNADSSEFKINYSGATPSIFSAMLTSSASSITYSPSRPTTETAFQKVYAAGSHGYQLGLDTIPLPDTTTAQKNAAWGSTTGHPTSSGVYMTAGAGIYIVGDSTMRLTASSDYTQTFTITQSSNTWVATINWATNLMSLRKNSGSTTSYSGTTGVIYSTGNITMSGVIGDNQVVNGAIVKRNSFTIATDINNGKNITLDGTLVHNTQLNLDEDMTSSNNMRTGTLGLLARNVIVSSSAPTSMQIDAVMMTGSNSVSDGSFYVANYSTRTPVGTLRVTGGIIQKARGPVGTISNNVVNRGYNKAYYYDSRIASYPPPYFPITPNYDRLSWRRL